MYKIKHLFLTLCFFLATMVSAQDNQNSDVFSQSTGDMYIVLGTTMAGAILGLSTLSFAEVPSEHLRNILVGASIGTIIGVGVVAFQQAGKSREYYEDSVGGDQAEVNFSTSKRLAWHRLSISKNYQKNKKIPYVNYSFQF